MSKTILVAIAAAMAIGLPTAASALSKNTDVVVNGETGAVTRSIGVSVGDLDLADTHGLRMADSRIVRAAKKVCGYESGSIMSPTKDYRNCYGDALDEARSDLQTLVQSTARG